MRILRGGGDAVVWSDFRLSEDGDNRFLFRNRRLNACRQGRMIRRLLEIETYRMMASLSLNTAKTLSAQLDVLTKPWSRSPNETPTPAAATRKPCWRISPACQPKWSAVP